MIKLELESLYDLKTMSEIETEYNIPRQTLHSRIKNLQDGIDYRKLGQRQSMLFSPSGVKKITQTTRTSPKKDPLEKKTKKELIELLRKKEIN